MVQWRIGELLVKKKIISWEQLEEALDEREKTREQTGAILVRKGMISENLLYRTLAEQNEMRFVDLEKVRINPRAVELVPAEYARKYGVMPIEYYDGCLTLGLPSAIHIWSEEELKQNSDIREIQSVLCLPLHIQALHSIYY